MKIVKRICLSFAALLVASSLWAQKPLEGVWLVGKKNTKVQTYQKGDEWFGKVIETDSPKMKIGTDILLNFKMVDGEWLGQMYVVRFGKKINARIEAQKDVLLVHMTKGFISKKMKWLRVKED